jgi:exonuclease VII small subunit
MSLANLLQSYSQDIAAREQHNNEVGERNATMKADDMKEQFQKHLDNLNAEAVDLGAASTAYHMGRKLYKKYKEGNKVVKSLQDLKDSLTPKAPTGEEGDAGKSQAGQEPHDGNQGADRGGAGEDSDIQPRLGAEPNAQANSSEARADEVQVRNDQIGELPDQPFSAEGRFQGKSNIRAAQQAREGAGGGSEATGGTASADAPATGDTSVAPTSEPAPAAQAEPTSQTGGRATLGTRDIQNPDLQSTLSGEPGSGDLFSTPRTLEQSRIRASGNRNTAPNTGEGGGAESGAGDVRAAQLGGEQRAATGTELESGINDADRGVGALSRAGAAVSDTINGIKTSVGNMAENVASKVGGAVKSVLPESMSSLGTDAAISAGLDAIPVVGEVASVITGLVSLFEGIHHDDAKPKAAPPEAEPVQVASGIDASALQRGQQAQTSATIV